jgi:hypothetical protein
MGKYTIFKKETTSYVWEKYFAQLKRFHDEKGGPVHIPYNKEHKGLARWMDRQKISRCMTLRQRQKILELGYSLDKLQKEDRTTRCDKTWKAHFESLKQYKATYGNCNVPSTYVKNRKLANWVASQRRAFGRDDLKDDRLQLLMEIQFVFRLVQRPIGVSCIGKNEAKWNQKYGEVEKLWKLHGTSFIPHVIKENPNLYNWITRQRQLYKKEDGLTEDRIEKLKKLSFPWKFTNIK